MGLFGKLNDFEISECEQEIASYKRSKAAATNASDKKFYQVEILKAQERLKNLKKAKKK